MTTRAETIKKFAKQIQIHHGDISAHEARNYAVAYIGFIEHNMQIFEWTRPDIVNIKTGKVIKVK